MAYCDQCGNYDEAYPNQLSIDGDYQPELLTTGPDLRIARVGLSAH